MNTLYILDAPDRDIHLHHYVLEGLKQRGFSPIVVYFTGSVASSKLAQQGHRAVSLNLSTRGYKTFNPGPIFRLNKLVRKTGASLLHVQRHRALIYAGLSCKFTGKPLIYTISSTQLIRNAKRRFAFRIISPNLTRMIAASQGAKEDYLNRTAYPAEKIEVVSNGIDIEPYQINVDRHEVRKKFGLPVKGFIFGMAARFKKAKDQPGLIRAFAKALPELNNSFLALAGDGPREKMIKEIIHELSIEKRVILTGRIDPSHIPCFLKSLDVFVHPSFREGMPASVLEAMAAGLPVIATDAEGVTDIFDSDKDFGRMILRGDTDGFANAMMELYGLSEEQRELMGRHSMERLKEGGFTREQMAAGTVEVYKNILAEDTRR